ncbi:unnamed protein product, partial [Brachionus calyciflorus]
MNDNNKIYGTLSEFQSCDFENLDRSVIKYSEYADCDIEDFQNILVDPSDDPLAKFPLFNTVNELTPPVCPVNVLIKLKSFKFQIFIDPSPDPLATFPLFNTVNATTNCICSVNVLINLPSILFQILIVPSTDPLAKFPLFNTVNELTPLVCTVNVAINGLIVVGLVVAIDVVEDVREHSHAGIFSI